MDDFSSEMVSLFLAGEAKLVDSTGEKVQIYSSIYTTVLRRPDLDEVDKIGKLQRNMFWNRKEDGRIVNVKR